MASFTRKNLLHIGGYVSFFFTCFTLFAYWTFPYDRVRDLLVSKAEAASAPGTRLKIGDLGPHWLTGVTLKDVTLERPSAEPGGEPSTIKLSKLSLRAAPLTMLFGGTGVSFDAVAGTGEIEGTYTAKKEGPAHIDVTLDALDLAALGAGSSLGVPVHGETTGKVDLTLADTPAETQGEIDLRIDKLTIGDGKAKMKIPGFGPMTIETLNAGTLELKATVKEGFATLEKLEAKGKDIELSGTGSLRVVRNFAQSVADFTLGVKLKDAYAKRNDRTKAIVDLMNMQLSRFASADGMIRFRISGPLGNPVAMPTGPSSAPAAPARKRKHGG